MEEIKKTAWWFYPFIGIMAILTIGLLFFVIPTKPKAPLVVVSHTTKLSGLNAWWANLYNDNMVLFTILTIVFISVFGVILGTLADFIMHRTGIDLRKRELKEH